MRIIVIGLLVSSVLAGAAAAQVNATVVKPPSWRKAVTPTRALAAEDARARGRAAYLAGKAPDALVSEVRAAHPRGGDEIVATALKEARAAGKAEVDTLKGDGISPLGEAERLRLQAAVDRLSTFEQVLSNLLRKMAETQSAITGNLK